jgi:hypothetical protein
MRIPTHAWPCSSVTEAIRWQSDAVRPAPGLPRQGCGTHTRIVTGYFGACSQRPRRRIILYLMAHNAFVLSNWKQRLIFSNPVLAGAGNPVCGLALASIRAAAISVYACMVTVQDGARIATVYSTRKLDAGDIFPAELIELRHVFIGRPSFMSIPFCRGGRVCKLLGLT